jgi:hypothetical protein
MAIIPCPECGEPVSEFKDSCPECDSPLDVPPLPKKNIFKKIMSLKAAGLAFFFLLGLGLAGIIFEVSGEDHENFFRNQASDVPMDYEDLPRVSAGYLSHEFEDNEAEAKKKYFGQRVSVDGIVAFVDYTIVGAPSLRLKGADLFNWVVADLDRSLNEAAIRLRYGDRVVLRCKVTDYVSGSVMMEGCSFAR